MMLRPRAQLLCERALAQSIVLRPLRDTFTISRRASSSSSSSQALPYRRLTTPQRRPLLLLLLVDSQCHHFTTSTRRPADPSNLPKTSPTSSTPDLEAEPEPAPSSSEPEVQPQPQRKLKRPRRRALYYSALFLLLGSTLGTLFRLTIAPPAPPEPGSAEDAYMLSRIQSDGESLPLVRALSSDPSFASWDAYSNYRDPSLSSPSEEEGSSSVSLARSRITSGPMARSRGLAFQRVFWNRATGEVVSVVYFGAGTAGWPGVVHGGALATVLDESLGRCAILKFPARTGVTARLEVAYKRPTLTNGFYVVRTRPILSERDDAVGRDGTRKSERKLWVEGTLETENGKVCVEAKGLFVVPKGFDLKPLVEGF